MDFYNDSDAKSSAEAASIAEAKEIVAEQGRDWEQIIIEAMQACGYGEWKIEAAIAAYRENGSIPSVAIAMVGNRHSGFRRTEWELRGSRNGE